MSGVIGGMRAAVSARPVLFATVAVGFPIAFHATMLAALIVRFGDLPNYVTGYDWLRNVGRIIASTGSPRDALSIALDEWLLEVGYMNHDYSLGISEWSLALIPHKMLLVVLAGLLVALNVVLLARRRDRSAGALATGVGAACAVTGSVTLFWVVCCATPTWSVGLAMLGIVGSTTALLLDPFGTWIALAGFLILLIAAIALAASGTRTAGVLREARA
jgi:hypothetical protein